LPGRRKTGSIENQISFSFRPYRLPGYIFKATALEFFVGIEEGEIKSLPFYKK
jgi:hypothetical protein